MAKTVAVVLAAGASTRMGAPKQLLPFAGKTVLRQVVDELLATSIDEVIVVLGCRAEEIRRSLLPSFRTTQALTPGPAPIGRGVRGEGCRLRTEVNADWESGMLSSVQCGLRALKGNAVTFALALGDQPGMPARIIEELLQAQRKNPGSIVIPKRGERRGHPVIFDVSFAREILALTSEQTLRDVVGRNAERIIYVSVDSSDQMEDIDTPADYQRALERSERDRTIERSACNP